MEMILLLFRLSLAGIFALAGIAKFMDLKGSENAFRDFGIPQVITLPASIGLSVLEILIAVLFISSSTAWFGAIGASVLLVLFIGQMIYQMAKGNAPDCHCFGQIHSEPVGKKSLVRNIIFAVPAVFLVFQGRENQGLSLAQLSNEMALQLGFGLLITCFLLGVAFWLKKILEQQTQIIKRLDLMELISREDSAVERDKAGIPNDGLPIGALFPDFELPDTNGQTVSLDKLLELRKPVLFVFVSPTCNPCKALVPEFDRWQPELVSKVNIVFVSSGDAGENLDKFGGSSPKTILLQKGRELADLARAKWTPTAILTDAQGRIASHATAGDQAIKA